MSNPVKYWRQRGVQIGSGCYIFESASFGSEPYMIKLGNNVRVNKNVQFITHDGGMWVLRNLYEKYEDADLFGTITVGNNVHIGNNAVILPGSNIGNNCIIGCCAVVTKPVPDNSIVVGVPGRVIENIEEYESKHNNEFEYIKNFDSQKKKKYLIKKYWSDSNLHMY